VAQWPVLQRLRLAYHANALRNDAVARLVTRIAQALAPAGIPLILLKGAALIRTLYTDAGLRRVGDIDALVDERDLARAGTALERTGFRRQRRAIKPEWPTCEFHALYHHPAFLAAPLELHWRLFEEYLPYLLDLPAVRERAQPIPGLPGGVSTMSPEHQLVHLCTHLERHALVYRSVLDRNDWLEVLVRPRGEARLVWLYDVALYLKSRAATLDWDRLVGDARRGAIEGRLHAVLELCRRTFEVETPREVLRALGAGRVGFVERAAHRTVIELDRARDAVSRRATPSARLQRWLGILSNRAVGWSHMWTSLFPPAGYLAVRYPGSPSTARRRARHLETMAPEVWRAIGRRLSTSRAPRRGWSP